LCPFSTRQIFSHKQRKKQFDWLATNTDVITSQSHSIFARLRKKNCQVESEIKTYTFATEISTSRRSLFHLPTEIFPLKMEKFCTSDTQFFTHQLQYYP
jgi:hypothetical protein